jgi:beta-exotoxin I transport system ATP-binding protein
MADVIVAEGLTKSYGAERGVVDLSFAVPPGEVFGYLGPNGAGKTTTIRTLLDFIRPTVGRARIFGLDSAEGSIEIHRRTGYLPGELALYERMTAADYLTHFAALRDGVDWGDVLRLAERLDLRLETRIRSLSHGNKQKVGLVQAFMHRPELLVLDEPTTGLDPLVQQEFHTMIAEARLGGSTVFLSSHVMPEVERLCDRVGIIREGRLVAVEDVGDLKARAIRTLDIRFARPVPGEAFAGLPGVQRIEVQGDLVHLTVAGHVDAVVKAAALYEVLDITSNEPTLEEVFLTFYGEGGNRDR